MNCPECSNYNRAKGTKACLTCPQYLDVIKTSGKRSSICIDVIPQIILEAVPDSKEMNVQEAIRQLPLEYSVPLIMYYILNANQREIGNYLKVSQKQVSKKINYSIEIIKKMTIFEP